MILKRLPILAVSLFLSVIFLFSQTVMAEDAKFIYPFHKVITSAAKIRVIGKAGGKQNLSLSVENSSGKTDYALTPEYNHFSYEIEIIRGKNTVSLLTGQDTADSIEIILADGDLAEPYPEGFLPYYLHSKGSLSGKCESCHPGNNQNVPQYKYMVQQVSCITNECHAKFDQGKFKHKPFQEGSCVKCHNPHGSDNENFLKFSGSDLCFTCHTDAEIMVQDAKNVHFPVLKGECTACHDPHKSDLEFHLKRDSIAGLCAGCHGQTVTSHNILHQPVKSGDCIACHQPHVSNYKRMLQFEGSDLCFNCHKVRKDEFENDHVHEPVRKDCKICHDPHGSATPRQLRTQKDESGNYISEEQPIKALCLNCHRKLNPELVDQLENGKVQHEPVAKGECTVCHTPHTTNNQKLLKEQVTDICYSCHQKMKELITSSIYKHGPVRTAGCAQCHEVHGSDHTKLLRANFSTQYNIDFDLKNYDLCFSCHESSIVLNKTVHNTTGFKNGKENLHYLHVNTKGRNCITCHDIHASNQELHVRQKIPFKKRFSITLKFTRTADGGRCAEGCHRPREYNRVNAVINK